MWRIFGSLAYIIGLLLQQVLILILGLDLVDNFIAFDARGVLAWIPYESEAGIWTLYFPLHILQLRRRHLLHDNDSCIVPGLIS